jgi:hypothetical protein
MKTRKIYMPSNDLFSFKDLILIAFLLHIEIFQPPRILLRNMLWSDPESRYLSAFQIVILPLKALARLSTVSQNGLACKVEIASRRVAEKVYNIDHNDDEFGESSVRSFKRT